MASAYSAPRGGASPHAAAWHRLLQYFAIATALSVYQFILFKLIGFYLIPANLLLCFLIIGHPLGVLVGLRWFRGRLDLAVRWGAAVLAATLVAFLVLPFFQAIFAGSVLQVIVLARVLLVVLVTGLTFLPSFVAAGLLEYGIIDEAHAHGVPFGRSYGTLLLGAMTGLLVGYTLLPRGGLVTLVLLVFVLLGAGLQAAVLGARRNAWRWLVVGGLAGLGALSAGRPGVDAAFIYAILPNAEATARAAIERGAQPVHQAWGKYTHVMILRDDNGLVSGAYNNLLFWSTAPSYIAAQDYVFDTAAMSLVRPGGRVAILGSGGGRQIHSALGAGRDVQIEAFEIEPAVVEYFADVAPEANGNLASHPRVRTQAIDGRKGVLASPAPYDSIFAASAGSPFTYYKSLLLNLHFLYTTEAFAAYAPHLRRDGFMAFHINRFLFDHGMAQRVINQMAHIGLETAAWGDDHFGFVVGAWPEHFAGYKARLDEFFADHAEVEALRLPPDLSVANPLPTDDWNGYFIFEIVSQPTLALAFAAALTAITLLLIGATRFVARRLAPSLGHAPRDLRIWFLQALVLGVNFVLLENMLIYELTKVLLDITDAVIIGSVIFLFPTALGALLSHERWVWLATALLLVMVSISLAALYAPQHVPPLTLFIAEGGVFFASGALFPLLLRRAGIGGMPYVLAIDTFGAGIGTFLVLFVPLLYGIRAFSAVALLFCAAAGLFVVLVGRRGAASAEDMVIV